jgi:hypothetical protein
MKKPRIYIDTSVVGGCLDERFSESSHALMDRARASLAVLLVSDVLIDELGGAPDEVAAILADLPPIAIESVHTTDEALQLQDAYLAAGVVDKNAHFDALHVALATIARADLIVSWNFRHIVHYDRIRAFNAVNLREGYGVVTIHSPREVV